MQAQPGLSVLFFLQDAGLFGMLRNKKNNKNYTENEGYQCLRPWLGQLIRYQLPEWITSGDDIDGRTAYAPPIAVLITPDEPVHDQLMPGLEDNEEYHSLSQNHRIQGVSLQCTRAIFYSRQKTEGGDWEEQLRANEATRCDWIALPTPSIDTPRGCGSEFFLKLHLACLSAPKKEMKTNDKHLAISIA